MQQEHLVQVGSLFKICHIEHDPVLLKAKQLKTSDQKFECRIVCIYDSAVLNTFVRMKTCYIILVTYTTDSNLECVCLCHGRFLPCEY